MFFEYPVPVGIKQTKASPAVVDAVLCVGTVTQVAVQFPAGCAAMVFVTIWRGEHQVWPVNLDEAIQGEDAIISWPESYVLDELEYGFQIRAWAPLTDYTHTVTVRFAVQPLPEIPAEVIEEALGPTLAELLGW